MSKCIALELAQTKIMPKILASFILFVMNKSIPMIVNAFIGITIRSFGKGGETKEKLFPLNL